MKRDLYLGGFNDLAITDCFATFASLKLKIKNEKLKVEFYKKSSQNDTYIFHFSLLIFNLLLWGIP